MDQELTGHGFSKFVRRRGLLGYEDNQNLEDFQITEDSDGLVESPHRGQERDQHGQYRTSSTHGASSARRNGASAASDPATIRRHPRHPVPEPVPAPAPVVPEPAPSSRRRRRDEDETGTKKQYKCEYCSLEFGRKHHKERHVANIHRQEKPYVCSICAHPFHQKPNLDRHRATVHSEVNPFKCQECGLAFSRRSLLRTHIQSVHDRSRRHECPFCREVFSLLRDLTIHMGVNHPAPGQGHGGSSNGYNHAGSSSRGRHGSGGRY